MTVPHFKGNPDKLEYWKEREEQIQYLHNKREWLVDRIEEERDNFPEFIKQWQREEGIEDNLMAHFRSEVDPEEVKNGHQLFIEVSINKVKHPFSHILETYMIERKRIVEHQLKLIRDTVNPNKVGDSFSLREFINSLEELKKGSLSKDAWHFKLIHRDPSFFHNIREFTEFLEHVDTQRNNLSHFQAEVNKDIELKFNVAEKKRNQIVPKRSSSADDFTVKLGDMQLSEFLEKDEENFEQFSLRCQVAFNRVSTFFNIRRLIDTSENGFINWELLEDS